MDIVERLIVYRDRPGRSREGRELFGRGGERNRPTPQSFAKVLQDIIIETKKAAEFPPPPVASTDSD
jgi:hypothetical protein